MKIQRKHEMGPGGTCYCPRCETEIEHGRGNPCLEIKCPNCGAKMVRKGSDHYQQIQDKRRKA